MRDLKVIKPKYVEKAWGSELWIHNDEDYCGKILQFNKGAKFSMHFHILKKETWYVSKGKLIMAWINPDTANRMEIIISEGDTIEVERGIPHQLEALEDSHVFEVSTQHYDEDSYRVEKGDSQK